MQLQRPHAGRCVGTTAEIKTGDTAMETMTAMVVSTAHLTQEEGGALASGDIIGNGNHLGQPMTWEHGGMFYVGEHGDWAAEDAGVSVGFTALIRIARDAGIEWIRFDADGPIVDGVVTHDW